MNSTVGARCSRPLRRGMTFSLRSPLGRVDKCLICSLLHWPMLRRSLLTAMVVGAVLTFLNHGDLLFVGSWAPALYWKIPLTYCVPFLVATLGALTNSRA